MSNQVQNVKIVTANPSALGLFGLAMVTLVASTQKLGITSEVSLVIPWAIFLGAFAQLIAAMEDFKHGNTFGATAFAAYGLFWLGVASSWLIRMGVLGEKLQETADVKQLGVAFLGYLIFTLIMTVAAVETNKILLIDFILIDLLFLGLFVSTVWGSHPMHMLAAVVELLIALVSFYGVAANVMNATFGREFLPAGKPLGIFKK